MQHGQGVLTDRQSWIISKCWGVLPAIIGSVLFGLPVDAAELQFWQFDNRQNQLNFSTDVAVLPRVQLIPNPTRLVVDLPGIQLQRPTVNQSFAGTIQSVRVGQVDNQTARIVVELAPNYVIDPNEVEVIPTSSTNWSIRLPTPQQVGSTIDTTNTPTRPSPLPQRPTQSSFPLLNPPVASPVNPSPVNPSPVNPFPVNPSGSSPGSQSVAPKPSPQLTARRTPSGPYLTDISVTPDGLFLKTSEKASQVSIRRSRDKSQVTVTLKNMAADPQLTAKTFTPGFFGLQGVKVSQSGDTNPETEITLQVNKSSPNWVSSTNRFGVVLTPQNPGLVLARPQRTVSLIQQQPISSSVAGLSGPTIEAVSLGGNQLLVQANGPISFATGWERDQYRLTIRSGQLATGIQPPRLGVGSPLSRIQFRQDAAGFSVLSTPAAGVRIEGVQRLSSSAIILNLSRAGAAQVAPFPSQIPVPPRSLPSNLGPLPRAGSRVVVLDPGHGGRDPGAIGINGLRETDVVLSISLDVSRILQQQGVTVYLTRTDEREIDLPPRVNLAERVRADVFVSIHANAISLSRPDVNGLETYYAPGATEGQRLAQSIHQSVLGSIRMGDRGVRSARFYVIRNTSMPATLVETGFLTGAEDNPRLADPNFRRQMAEAIARGILQYLARQ